MKNQDLLMMKSQVGWLEKQALRQVLYPDVLFVFLLVFVVIFIIQLETFQEILEN